MTYFFFHLPPTLVIFIHYKSRIAAATKYEECKGKFRLERVNLSTVAASLYASESDVCRRQILTHKDSHNNCRTITYIGIEIKQKELTKRFMMISN